MSSNHLKLCPTASVLLTETSVTCADEHAVLASVLCFWHFGRSASCHSLYSKEYCTWVVSSVHESVDALDMQCSWVVSSVLQMWCTWYENYPGLIMLPDCMMFIIGMKIFILNQFCFLNQERFELIHGLCPRIVVICWFGYSFCITTMCDMNCKCIHGMVQNCLILPFHFEGITPSEVCQEFYTSLFR